MNVKLIKVGKGLVSLQYIMSMISAVVLIAMICVEVFLRYVLKAPLMGIEEVMVFPIIWLYMLGGANASYERSHIECGILTLYIKKDKTKAFFDLVKTIVSLGILIWLSSWGYRHFTHSLKIWKYTDIANAPLFFAESALFIGFLLMTIYAVRDFILSIKSVIALNNDRIISKEGNEGDKQ